MKILGNILWLIFGGLILGLLWFVAGIICCVTLIGIPLGVECFKFAKLAFWPFGRDVEFGGSTGKMLLNILWISLCGWELATAAAGIGIIYCITIVGIPFGLQCFKFAKLALTPFGAKIVKTT